MTVKNDSGDVKSVSCCLLIQMGKVLDLSGSTAGNGRISTIRQLGWSDPSFLVKILGRHRGGGKNANFSSVLVRINKGASPMIIVNVRNLISNISIHISDVFSLSKL